MPQPKLKKSQTEIRQPDAQLSDKLLEDIRSSTQGKRIRLRAHSLYNDKADLLRSRHFMSSRGSLFLERELPSTFMIMDRKMRAQISRVHKASIIKKKPIVKVLEKKKIHIGLKQFTSAKRVAHKLKAKFIKRRSQTGQRWERELEFHKNAGSTSKGQKLE